ncbi:MAG: hypothetical protein QG608_3088, partial [Actinomycetota bacterium]|nr:hypothetical protein [Actinomycetota bacterium]
LLLPFLLDANLRPHRLSTFGTGERTMHWNLMGEGATGTTRVGYVWLEFERPTEPSRWFTCGARLAATAHTTTVQADYFTTDLRVGIPGGLSLSKDSGQPLTRRELDDALGTRGARHPSALEYRTAVRSELFPGLSEQRYEALLMALLQLRTPKLSQRLDPSLLSVLLSQALPPLGAAEISELAEGFERLDQQRERLRQGDREIEAAGELAARQQAYARRVLRASAAALSSATSELDKITRKARLSQEEHDHVAELLGTAEELRQTLHGERRGLDGRIEGLTGSEEYKKGRGLDRLRHQSEQAGLRAAKAEEQAARLQQDASHDARAAQNAGTGAAALARSSAGSAEQADRAADRAGLSSIHTRLHALSGSDEDGSGEQATDHRATDHRANDHRADEHGAEAQGADEPAAAEQPTGHPGGGPRALLRAAVEDRRHRIDTVCEALNHHDRALERRAEAETELEQARGEYGDLQQAQAEAEEHHRQARENLADAVLAWADSCREITFPDPAALADLVEAETDLLAEVDRAASLTLEQITRREEILRAEQRTAQGARSELTAEIHRLEQERDLPPPAPHTRTCDRTALDGAPLWRVVRFAEHLTETEQSRLEAALQASGLLDAWVLTTGAVVGHDLFAVPDALPSAPGASLADVLEPERDTPVPAPTLTSLLRSVALQRSVAPPEPITRTTPTETSPPAGPGPAHPAAIGSDGTWRMGPLTGTWDKPQAEYIGTTARRRARERRLGDLRARREDLDGILDGLSTALEQLASRRTQLTADRRARPSHADLTLARENLATAQSRAQAAEALVHRRAKTLLQREEQTQATLRKAEATAADYQVPADRTALRGLLSAADTYREQALTWLDAQERAATAHRYAQELAERADRSKQTAQDQSALALTAREEHQQIAGTLHAVEKNVGTSYRAMLEELTRLRTLCGEHDQRITQTGREVEHLTGRLGELRVRRTADDEARALAHTGRDAAAARFRHLCSGTFPADSGLERLDDLHSSLTASDGIRAALESARLVSATWNNVPHSPKNLADALHRLSESLHASRDHLAERADLEIETDEDIGVLTAIIDGTRVGARELFESLRAEAERNRQEITDRERELFDRTLTGDTRRHLAARIRQARELVDGINNRLERVRTASRVAVRLVWEVSPELPAGTRTARELLLKDPVRLGETDRQALHRFFRDRIEAAKAENTAANWEQQLAQVFDYTKWHRFVVKVDRANGAGWQVLTKKLHGALSGGEKAIALHLPLFAAVAAHYQTVPPAPRIILLDEVFVGVDTVNRGQVFALLAALDLDLMLTSDHEWCTYRELDGIAVHQLITGDGDDAVTTARFVWNGHEILSDP